MTLVPLHRKIFVWVLSDWLDRFPDDDLILEVGCGLGVWIESSSSHRRKIVGLDIDRRVCTLAFSRVGDRCAGIVQYSGDVFPFKDKSFQGVYTHEVIEHIENDNAFLSEIHRVLDDDGSLLLTTPNQNREPLRPDKHAAHVRHYTADQLKSKVRGHGFDVETHYWRMHPICGFLDDNILRISNRYIKVEPLQPGLVDWTASGQSRSTRFLVQIYKMIEPIIFMIVFMEFYILRSAYEARNIILTVSKNK